MWPFRSDKTGVYSSEQFLSEEDSLVLGETSRGLLPRKIAHGTQKVHPIGQAGVDTPDVMREANLKGAIFSTTRIIFAAILLLLFNISATIIVSIFVVPRIDCLSTFPSYMAHLCPLPPIVPSFHYKIPEPTSCVRSPVSPPHSPTCPATDQALTSSEDRIHESDGATSDAKPLSQLCHVGDGALAKAWEYIRHGTVGHCGDAYLALQDVKDCWEFSGSRAQLGIRLSNWTMVKRVGFESGRTVEESPRRVIVWGMLDGEENTSKFSQVPAEVRETLLSHVSNQHTPPSLNGFIFVPMTTFVYDFSGPARQEFEVFTELLDLAVEFGVVVVQILDNWGGPSTVVCRIEVLGM